MESQKYKILRHSYQGPSLGICLSGGGARGIAHTGVLQALEENGIYPSVLSGASAGAIVACLYAAGKRPAEILKIFKDSSLLKLFRLSVPASGISDNGYIMEVLKQHIAADDFAALEIPLFVSVTNFTRGRLEILHEGPLFEVIAASSSIPVLFKARKMGEDMYVDGGVLNNLPVEALKGRCEFVLGVNVTPVFPVSPPEKLLDAGYRAFDLVLWANVEERLKQCDFVIEPGAQVYGLFEISKADQIYQAGYDAAMRQMPDLLKKLERQRN
ncbi:MAG: patatin [Bacteroidetes bacterium]|nr:MAG: patatin [Bacteroidota bacterium]